MRIGILARQDSWYARDLCRAATDLGLHACVLDFRSLSADVAAGAVQYRGVNYAGESVLLNELSAVIVRTMPPGSLEEVVVRMDLLAGLQQADCRIVNSPRAIECAVDKYLTTSRLSAAGIPVPRTAVCESVDQAMSLYERFGSDAVLKPLFGSEGRGIVRLSDPETAFRVFKALRMTGAVLYLQEFVRHAGFDVRLLVLDGTVIAAMKRVNELDFRTNVNLHGQPRPHAASDQEIRLAVQAAEVTGTRVAGVDIIRDADGRVFVLEVNAVPGWKALARVSGVDVAARLMNSVLQCPS